MFAFTFFFSLLTLEAGEKASGETDGEGGDQVGYGQPSFKSSTKSQRELLQALQRWLREPHPLGPSALVGSPACPLISHSGKQCRFPLVTKLGFLAPAL